ncbi:hypothetical protein [Limobrevibacterium gyesilva]|uniref:Uncharacterized protein n=1 Tax=Limobrevibacterium gyesilva TaxID=2991712 RepID=A0AA41YR11_9PROT|nr:hypothetical protein [Limobrevibacterium gyesilva]MCW3477270.1 hypothetical protein [Limobrevibacterium gyesilva]
MLRCIAAFFAVGRVRLAPELWCRSSILLALRDARAAQGRAAGWHS